MVSEVMEQNGRHYYRWYTISCIPYVWCTGYDTEQIGAYLSDPPDLHYDNKEYVSVDYSIFLEYCLVAFSR